MLKSPSGNVKFERSGGLDHLVGGGDERSAFPTLLTLGSVDGGYGRIDNVDIEHLRGCHLEFDLGCTTCASMTMRERQHRRQDEGGTRLVSVVALSNKRNETIREAMVDMQLLMRGVWRFHDDEGREFMGAVDNWLRKHAVLHTTTGAYDPNATRLVEHSVGARKRGIKCLLHQTNVPVSLWLDAAKHAN